MSDTIIQSPSLSGQNSGLRLSVAATLGDVLEAWGLVHDRYVEAGLMVARDSGLCPPPSSAFNDRTAVILARIGYCVVGTLTVMLDGDAGLPLDRNCRTEIDAIRQSGAGRKLCEVGCHCTRGESYYHDAEMIRWGTWFGLRAGYTDMVIGIHPDNLRKFTHLFGFRKLGEVRAYTSFDDRPVIPMAQDIGVFKQPNPPKRVRLIADNPVPAASFAARYTFPEHEVMGSPLAEFLTTR